MSSNPVVSTGRGGSGNMGPDSNTYTDGDIVREGYEGDDAPPHLRGRGGAGNFGGSGKASGEPRSSSHDVVPETATREQGYSNFHTGRGGEGNVHKDKYGGHSGPQEGVGEKIKHAVEGDEHKK